MYDQVETRRDSPTANSSTVVHMIWRRRDRLKSVSHAVFKLQRVTHLLGSFHVQRGIARYPHDSES